MSESSSIQSHISLPILSKNPYAQRRSTTENRTQVTQPNPDINLLVDSTNVVLTSSVSQSQSTLKIPEANNDRDIEYDDDAMIDEYMEYDNEKPPDEYDPYMDEEFENTVPSGQATASEHTSTEHSSFLSTNSTSFQRLSAHVFREEEEQNDGNFDVADIVAPSMTFRNRPKTDLYKFERFVDHTQWRAEKMASPMRAKKWKINSGSCSVKNLRKDAHDNDKASASAINRDATTAVPTTSESMLLAFLHKRHYGTTIIPKGFTIQPKSCKLPQNPVIGKTSFPMTLGDGTRVHIPVQVAVDSGVPCREIAQAVQFTRNNSSYGVGIQVLLNRVRTNRRKREYEKVVQASRDVVDKERSAEKVVVAKTSPTSVTEASKLRSASQLWVDKHAPRTFAHLLSDERSNREVVRALRAWDPYVFHREPPKRLDTYAYRKFKDGESKDKIQESMLDSGITKSKDTRPDVSSRVILLSGPPGVGKTTLAHIVASHVGYRPIEVNGSDERTETALTDRVIRAMESSTLQFESTTSIGKGNMHDRPNCLILDEIDGADAAKAIQALVEIIRAEIPARNTKKKQQYLRRPIIFICNNKFVPALKPLLPYTKQFDIYPPSTTRLIARLRSILTAEDLSLYSGGNSLLNQLIVSSCGDIRSCLFTLQFAAATAKRKNTSNWTASTDEGSLDTLNSRSSDISKTLQCALRGDGLKDVRSDIVGTVTAVFHKEKALDVFGRSTNNRRENASLAMDKIFDTVRSFGDNARVLDCLFMNLQRVSFIDPSFDRCSAVLEWMSSTDCYRSNKQLSSPDGYYVEASHTPAVAAATHILCRVEQPQDLIYSIRDLTDSQYQMESNKALIQKFLDGFCLRAKSARTSLFQVSTEIVPNTLWILSAGEGSSALNRSVTSIDLLSKSEKDAFQHHAATLQSLGLKHVSIVNENDRNRQICQLSSRPLVGLDPPIDRLVQFVDISNIRLDIPSALKEMLSRTAVIGKSTATSTRIEEQPRQSGIKRKAFKNESAASNNFLLMGAKKAKALRSARSAARVGCIVNDSHQSTQHNHKEESTQRGRLSNTGSGMQLSQVVRLKYVKGFTQAVSMPCRLDDIS